MCRTAGRRCEHNWSEAQHQADLARRRAIYAQKATKPGTKLAAETPVQSAHENPITVDTVQDSCIQNMKQETQQCNLTYVTYAGDEAEFQAYNTTVITGQINPKKLHDSSYKEFDFQEPTRWGEKTVRDGQIIRKAIATSENELPALTYEQQAALATFTTDDYEDISRYLHESHLAPKLQKDTKHTKHTKWYPASINEQVATVRDEGGAATPEEAAYEEVRDVACTASLSGSRITPSKLTDYVNTLDEAFSKADGRQRIVYRGERFRPDEHQYVGHQSVEDYVNGKFTVGNQVSFKGMQSTSMDEEQAREYAAWGQGGIIYEISTPSGIGVAKVSAYEEESEVLLPRNSRYQVVGKTYITQNGGTFAVINLVEVDENNNIRHAGNLRKKGEFGKFDVTKFYDNTQK